MHPSRFEQMQQLLDEFRASRVAGRTRELHAMQQLLGAFRACTPTQTGSFNLFDLLKIAGNESMHSRLLAWLLDRRATHGQGNLFLRTFVGGCGLPLASHLLERYRVVPEFFGRESRIDMLVYSPGAFLIYLENKIVADEGPEQLSREFRDMQRLGATLRVPPDRRFALFLTPQGRTPGGKDAPHWHPIAYAQLSATFAPVLPRISSPKVAIIVHDWLEALAAFGGQDAEGATL